MRWVRAAGIVWPVPQANILTLTRLDRELVLAVRDQAPYSLAAGTEKIRVKQGREDQRAGQAAEALAGLQGQRPDYRRRAAAGLDLPAVTLTARQGFGVAVFEPKGGAGVAPGITRWCCAARRSRSPKNGQMPKGGPTNYVQVTPPIALTIVPKQLAKLSVSPKQASVQRGKTIELTVKVARQFDYTGPFTIVAMLSDQGKGLTVKAVPIPPNQDEAKLFITAARGLRRQLRDSANHSSDGVVRRGAGRT